MDNLKVAWNGWSRGNRVLVVVLAAGVIALAVTLGVWALRTNYQVLFADLDSRDAATIVEELKRMKIPYRIADDGTKILVDEDVVHETRLRLMGRGIPLSGGVGFEIFDNKDVGMTEYTQKINYQRALQGELARTIMSISIVKYARVHLAAGESSLFKRQKTKPKASVSLVLKPGARLAADQIAGIQRLVSAAVSGLEPGAVTVLDQRGVALSAAIDGDASYAQATGKLRLKKDAEKYFIRKITTVLDRTFGPGRAIVSVDVTLNFDEVTRTQQTVLPLRASAGEDGGAVVRKRQSVYRNGKGPITRTVDGDRSYAASPALTSTTDVEYEFGKTVEQVVSSPGGIRRVSVGVIVPNMSREQIQRVHDVVSMIIGYSAARGDAISVQPIADLMTAPAEPPMPAPESAPSTTPPPRARPTPIVVLHEWLRSAGMLNYAAVVGVGFLFGMLVVFLWSRARAPSAGATVTSPSDSQRSARLEEIKSWLAAERAKGSA